MPTGPSGQYNIDATDSTEPQNTRYVADFAAELRAMKLRMNSAISNLGSLTGALMADGTNYMTGKLGVGVVANASYMLDVSGATRFSGNVTVSNGRVLVDNGVNYTPSNPSVQNSGLTVYGSYGGGITMIDGTAYLGAYSVAGELWFGLGTSAGIQGRLRVLNSGVTAYGGSTSEVRSEAASGYAAFLAKASGTNSCYNFYWNATGERARITVSDDTSFVISRGTSAATSFSLDSSGNAQVHGDQVLVGTASGNVQKRVGFVNSTYYHYLCLNTDGSFALWDNTNAKNRWISGSNGYFSVETALQAGFGQAGNKYMLFSNADRYAYFYMNSSGGDIGLYDATASKTRWKSALDGMLSAPYFRAVEPKAIGYDTGAGGSVTQLTNKTTGVTLHKPTGRITTHNESMAPGVTKYFPLSNNTVTANSVVCVSADPSTCAAAYNISTYCSNGTCIILLQNNSGVTLSDAIGLNFVVLNGATS